MVAPRKVNRGLIVDDPNSGDMKEKIEESNLPASSNSEVREVHLSGNLRKKLYNEVFFTTSDDVVDDPISDDMRQGKLSVIGNLEQFMQHLFSQKPKIESITTKD